MSRDPLEPLANSTNNGIDPLLAGKLNATIPVSQVLQPGSPAKTSEKIAASRIVLEYALRGQAALVNTSMIRFDDPQPKTLIEQHEEFMRLMCGDLPSFVAGRGTAGADDLI